MKKSFFAFAFVVLGVACGGSDSSSSTSPAPFTPDRSSLQAQCTSTCDGADSSVVTGPLCDCRCGMTPHSFKAKMVFGLADDPAIWHAYWLGLQPDCTRPSQCSADADCPGGSVCDVGASGGLCITSCQTPSAPACAAPETCRADGHCR